MPRLAHLRSRVLRSIKGQGQPASAPNKAQAQSQARRREGVMACQSLCLQCDARTPCTLGRLIG